MNGRGNKWKQEAGAEAQKAQIQSVAEARRKNKNYLKRKRDNIVKMTGIFINGNRKQRITNDEFDVMVELMKAENDLVLQRMNEKVSESDDQLLRWKDDQKTYHQNYYNKNLKQPYTCEDCGRTISSKSNLSKHKKSNVCNKNKNPPF